MIEHEAVVPFLEIEQVFRDIEVTKFVEECLGVRMVHVVADETAFGMIPIGAAEITGERRVVKGEIRHVLVDDHIGVDPCPAITIRRDQVGAGEGEDFVAEAGGLKAIILGDALMIVGDEDAALAVLVEIDIDDAGIAFLRLVCFVEDVEQGVLGKVLDEAFEEAFAVSLVTGFAKRGDVNVHFSPLQPIQRAIDWRTDNVRSP